MELSEQDRIRFARHLLLPQLGEAGQRRLLRARVRPAADADPGALAVARTYLARAGVAVIDASDDGADAVPLAVSSESEVSRVAGRPELRVAARALLGALAAVEAIQTAAGVATRARAPDLLSISSEDA